jgi:uncharacterized surface protein with fasciclin (FAS1) repeats
MLTRLMTATALTIVLGLSQANAANVVETAASTGQFKTLLAAAKAAGVADALATTQNITVFAPTDDAFAKLPAGTVEGLLKPENKDKLKAILLYHVVPSKIMASQVPTDATAVATLDDKATISVKRSGDGVTINKSKVIQADVAADNGVIHVIDQVLLPSS